MENVKINHLNQRFFFFFLNNQIAGETQLTVMPSLTGWMTATGTSLALSPPDAFPHAFYIQIPRCIENVFIEWCLVLTIKLFSS